MFSDGFRRHAPSLSTRSIMSLARQSMAALGFHDARSKKCFAASRVVIVPPTVLVAMSLSACNIVGSTARAQHAPRVTVGSQC